MIWEEVKGLERFVWRVEDARVGDVEEAALAYGELYMDGWVSRELLGVRYLIR